MGPSNNEQVASTLKAQVEEQRLHAMKEKPLDELLIDKNLRALHIRLFVCSRSRFQPRTMPPAKSWKGSEAKAQLQEDLLSGFISLQKILPYKDDHEKRAIYKEFPLKTFTRNLRTARKRIKQKKDASADDEAALQRDRILFPVPTHDLAGRLRWEGSDAERLLKEDMEAGEHTTSKPKELWLSRMEYTMFDLKTFRDHIYQVTKTKVFRDYVKNRNGENEGDEEE